MGEKGEWVVKAKKIYGIAKETKTLNVWTSHDGRQFFNFGGAVYLIDGMPRMEDDEFLAYLDVPKPKRDEWDVTMVPARECLVQDVCDDDRELKPDAVSIIVSGRHMMAFHMAEGGVIWMDEDKLSPLSAAEWRFFLRASETGETYIAVFEGLYLIALLSYELTPEIMPGEGLADRLCALAGIKEAAVDAGEIIEAAKQAVCDHTYPTTDRDGKPIMAWKTKEGYDVLNALKEMYDGSQ